MGVEGGRTGGKEKKTHQVRSTEVLNFSLKSTCKQEASLQQQKEDNAAVKLKKKEGSGGKGKGVKASEIGESLTSLEG